MHTNNSSLRAVIFLIRRLKLFIQTINGDMLIKLKGHTFLNNLRDKRQIGNWAIRCEAVSI